MADEWNVTKPVDSLLIPNIPLEIRKLRSSAKIIISVGHITPGDGNSGGQHRLGSARVYLQSAMPTTAPNGDALSTTYNQPATHHDDGRLWIDTSNGYILKAYVSTGSGITAGWVNVTVGLMKAAADIDANNFNVINMKSGTQSGQGMHIGQLDDDHFEGKSTGLIAVRLHSTGYLVKSGSEGLIAVKTRQNKSATAKGVSDITGPASWTDMTNMSLSIKTAGGNLFLIFSATFYCAASTDYECRFDVDGTPYKVTKDEIDADTNDSAFSMHTIVTGLASTTHTVKVQWRYTQGGSGFEQPGATHPRELSAIEFPAAA